MTEILAQWWALLAACTVIVWAVRNSNIGEYDCIDIEYEVQDIHVGGTYCVNPYWDIVNKDVKVKKPLSHGND